MSTRYYLPFRHDELSKTLLNSHLKKFYSSKSITLSSAPEYIYKAKKTHVNTGGMYQ